MSSSNVSIGTKTRLSVVEDLRRQLEAELGPETSRRIRHALQLKYGVHCPAVSRVSTSRTSPPKNVWHRLG